MPTRRYITFGDKMRKEAFYCTFSKLLLERFNRLGVDSDPFDETVQFRFILPDPLVQIGYGFLFIYYLRPKSCLQKFR